MLTVRLRAVLLVILLMFISRVAEAGIAVTSRSPTDPPIDGNHTIFIPVVSSTTVNPNALLPVECAVNGFTDFSTLAKAMIQDAEGEQVRNCSSLLTTEYKAVLFETIAEHNGVNIEDFRQEADQMYSTSDTQVLAAAYWTQLIERRIFQTSRPLVSSGGWFPNLSTCDNDPSDVESIFSFTFSSAITNPDALGNFSYHPLVDAMLSWYQVRYGGLKGYGSTNGSIVFVCVGNQGASLAGGQGNIQNHMKLWR